MRNTFIKSFLFNDFSRDIRVYKENVSFLKLGYRARVVATSGHNLPEIEIKDGIEIIRLKIPSINIIPIRLVVFWIKCIFKFNTAPLIHCNDLYTLPIGAAIKLFFNKNVKIVYDCHEYETDVGILINKPILKFLARLVETLLIKTADVVVTVSDSIAESYSSKYKIEKPKLVMNCIPYQEFPKYNVFRKKLNIPQSTKIFLYHGEFTKDKVAGINFIIDAFKEVGEELNFVIIFLGYGAFFANYSRRYSNNPNIIFYPAVDFDEYMKYVCSADVGIHILEPTCLNNEYALPNKIFEYIAAGIPVIVSGSKEMRSLVSKTGIGFVLNQNSKETLVEVLRNIKALDLTKYSNNIKKAYQIYNWENQEIVLSEIYDSLSNK